MIKDEHVQILKMVSGFVISAGVHRIVSGVVKSNVPKTNLFNNTLVYIGKVGIGVVIDDIINEHVNAKIDKAVVSIKQLADE